MKSQNDMTCLPGSLSSPNIEHETMPPQPPARLEFTDCLSCGKRVATSAPLCRHCNTKRSASIVTVSVQKLRNPVKVEHDADEEAEDADSHAALGLGGYGHDDWDEADERNELTTKTKNLWWYVV